MGDLSQHFSRKVFECRCCGRLQLDSHLVEGLEAVRTLAGVPVVINAGYRCPHHNQEVGGVPTASLPGAWLPISGCPGSRCSRCTNWRRGYRNLPMAVLGCTTEIFCTWMCAVIAPAGHGWAAPMLGSSS
jgi:hypothetical protein